MSRRERCHLSTAPGDEQYPALEVVLGRLEIYLYASVSSALVPRALYIGLASHVPYRRRILIARSRFDCLFLVLYCLR